MPGLPFASFFFTSLLAIMHVCGLSISPPCTNGSTSRKECSGKSFWKEKWRVFNHVCVWQHWWICMKRRMDGDGRRTVIGWTAIRAEVARSDVWCVQVSCYRNVWFIFCVGIFRNWVFLSWVCWKRTFSLVLSLPHSGTWSRCRFCTFFFSHYFLPTSNSNHTPATSTAIPSWGQFPRPLETWPIWQICREVFIIFKL